MIARSLKHELRFHCCDEDVFQGVRFVQAVPRMPTVDLVPVDVAVSRAGEQYCLRHGLVDVTGSVSDIVDAAHTVIRDILLTEFGSGLLLHAASFRVNDQNIVVFAEKGTGKTTLALKLLESGYTVFCDEHVLISRSRLFPRPRTLRVKQGSIEFVPALAASIEASPAFENWDGSMLYSVAPETEAAPWKLTDFSANHFIHLTANHGAGTILSRSSTEDTFEVAMQQSFLADNHKGSGLAALYEAISRARCWHMRIGDTDEAVDLFNRITASGNQSDGSRAP